MPIIVWRHMTMYVVALEYTPYIETDEPCYPIEEERPDSETLAVESMPRWIGQR